MMTVQLCGTRRCVVRVGAVALLTLAAACSPEGALREGSPDGGDWPTYGGDAGAMRYSPLTVINRENIGELTLAWTWATGEGPLAGPRLPVPGEGVRPGNFQNTPVVINDTMYVSTPYNRVAALDGATGREIWTYDPKTTDWGQPPNGTGFVHRGVAVWSGHGGRRVFLNSRWRLIALDAATGNVIESFGDGGEIDLTEKLLWPTNRLHYTQTSPPVIFEDLVILGNGVWDGFVYEQDPPGNVQAFDVHTGELVWNFNLIPQADEFGTETWEDEAWQRVGHTNAWAPMSVDRERGLLYVPVGTPSNDYYGGHRLGDNLFAESLLTLDARTGERLWHFQIVRHGLWDYDLPSQPSLFQTTVDGRTIDAVVVSSKMGFLYTFDRLTGEPVWPIEDRPVPASDVPGERAAATQPFPTKPPPFERQGFTEEDVIDFTPALRNEALDLVRSYRLGPLYTPPSLEGTVTSPGVIGGGNWGGTAIDPATGVLYVKSTNNPAVLKLAEPDASRTEGNYGIDRSRRSFRLANGLPVHKPPYGTLTAMNMQTGEMAWQVPLGDTPNVRDHPDLAGVELPDRLGVTGAPGPIVTGGGLVFLSGGGATLYAIDSATGDELWSADLGQGAYANPMTFRTRGGRQFVVIATGRGAGATLQAFALPQ